MDNINFVARDTNSVFTQHLNIDYAINYYGEVVKSSGNTFNTNTTTRRVFAKNAIITEQFTGRFVGTSMWISNLMINAPSSDNVGLFAENAGIIEQVTLRLYSFTTDTIIGRSNVGGIAGTNASSGTVRNCFVQQVVTRDTQGQLPAWSNHPAAVRGTSNVGGIVGNNLGALNDVIFTSTSARPAVKGTNTASVGGIAGVTTNAIDNIMYLAVAPRIGNGMVAMRPFTGSNLSVGTNSVYLSGEPTLRPFQTFIDGAAASQTDYNRMPTGQQLNFTPMDTKNIVESYSTVQFNNNWTINNTSGINFESLQNHASFLYPYPIGTAPSTNRDEWPVVASIPTDIPKEMGVIYYERYQDGGIGIFARYYEGEYLRTIDYLRYDNPIIIEAGYGAHFEIGVSLSGNRPVAYSQYIGGRWTDFELNRLDPSGGGNQMSLDNYLLTVSYLPGQFVYLPQSLLNTAAEKSPNPIEPMIIWINKDSANHVQGLGIYSFINPFFAKEVYPVTLTCADKQPPTIPSTVKQIHPTEHVIRTPWQLQNISLYNEKSAALCNDKHTFIQEIDIDMSKTGLGVTLTSPPGNNQPTVAQLANIVRGEFNGIYDGQGNNIINLSLVNNTSSGTNITRDSKGLFKTIGINGIVGNLSIYNSLIQNGSNNGSFASINNGVIRNAAFISGNSTTLISQQPITGTGNTGGIVGINNGTIENALFLAQASGSSATSIAPITVITGTGKEINAYYLSGTYSSALRPTQAPQIANYNIFPTSTVVRGEPRTTQELNANNGLDGFWRQSSVLTLNNTMLDEHNPYPYLGTSPTITWPVATIVAKDIVYFEEYDNGTVGFYSAQNDSGLPGLSNDNDVQIKRYGYAVMIDRPGTFGVSININNGNNAFINSIDTARPGVGVETNYYYAIIPTNVVSGISGEIFVNDQATGHWMDTRFAKAVYTNQAALTNPAKIFIRTPQQMVQISSLTITAGIEFTQERDLDFSEIVLGNSAAAVTGTFKGIFDGGGNIIRGLTINYTQTGASARSYVGLFSHNSGIISRVTLVFDGSSKSSPIIGNVNSVAGSVVYVGSIAGQNEGVITDISIVSSIHDTNGINAIAPTGGTGANAGGVVGENKGDIIRVVYLAPAPEYNKEIYPITNTQDEIFATYTDVYYLGGIYTPEAMIIESENNIINNIINPVIGFDYTELIQPIDGITMVDTVELYNFIGSLSDWTNQSPSNWTLPLSIPAYDSAYKDAYPYINRIISSNQSFPIAWLIVIEGEPEQNITELEMNIELEEMFEVESEEIATDENYIDDSNNNGDNSSIVDDDSEHENTPDEAPNDDEKEKPNESITDDVESIEEDCFVDNDEETINKDGFAIATGVITLFGGAGFTQTRVFKRYMRKRNARAVRRINEYNRNKRNGRRVNRYILRYHEQRNREWRR